MSTSFGDYLRELRQNRQLSQTGAARRAGIGRVTLNRWERELQRPRVLDLQRFLDALGATPVERQHAFALLATPQARAQTRETLAQLGERRGIGPLPHGGDLLRALRLRRGVAREEAARAVGVTARTLQRWEKADAWPSPELLQSLCYALGARPEELRALMGAHEALPEIADEGLEERLETLRAWARGLHAFTTDRDVDALKELGFWALESELWPLAARGDEARCLLSQVYGFRANHLARYERWAESATYADRALGLLPPDQSPDESHLLAGLALAKAEVYRGPRPAPARGLEVLKHWLGAATAPAYRAWLLSDMASYLTLAGDAPSGARVSQQAQQIAARCENPFELCHRQIDAAWLRVNSGDFQGALDGAERAASRLPVEALLIEVAARLGLGDRERARERLQQVLPLIETRALAHLRPRAARLARRLQLESLPSDSQAGWMLH